MVDSNLKHTLWLVEAGVIPQVAGVNPVPSDPSTRYLVPTQCDEKNTTQKELKRYTKLPK